MGGRGERGRERWGERKEGTDERGVEELRLGGGGGGGGRREKRDIGGHRECV